MSRITSQASSHCRLILLDVRSPPDVQAVLVRSCRLVAFNFTQKRTTGHSIALSKQNMVCRAGLPILQRTEHTFFAFRDEQSSFPVTVYIYFSHSCPCTSLFNINHPLAKLRAVLNQLLRRLPVTLCRPWPEQLPSLLSKHQIQALEFERLLRTKTFLYHSAYEVYFFSSSLPTIFVLGLPSNPTTPIFGTGPANQWAPPYLGKKYHTTDNNILPPSTTTV